MCGQGKAARALLRNPLGREPFLREEILSRVIQSLHADVLSGLHQGGAQPFQFSY
jgi:hypothetical protein